SRRREGGMRRTPRPARQVRHTADEKPFQRPRENTADALSRAELLAADTMRLYGVRVGNSTRAVEQVYDEQQRKLIQHCHFIWAGGLRITVNMDSNEVIVKAQ